MAVFSSFALRAKNFFNPFYRWTFAKILNELLRKLEALGVESPDARLMRRLSDLFPSVGKTKWDDLKDLLERYIKILEHESVKSGEDAKALAVAELGGPFADSNSEEAFGRLLEDPVVLRKVLTELIMELDLKRLVLMFDEAAHTLVPSEQNQFFTFFKALSRPPITCKAAIYPGITHFGGDFYYGHDAKILRLYRKIEDPNYFSFFYELLSRQLTEGDDDRLRRLDNYPDLRDVLILASSGVPRRLFHLIDMLDERRNYTEVGASAAIKDFTKTHLWRHHHGLGEKQEKFRAAVETASRFIREVVLPELREKNNKWRGDTKSELSVYFVIDHSVKDEFEPVLGTLIYSGVITPREPVFTMGGGRTGAVYAVHASLAVAESILKKDRSTGSSLIKEVGMLKTQRAKQFTAHSPELRKYIEAFNNLKSSAGPKCPSCGRPRNPEWLVCPWCTKRYPEELSLYEELRRSPVDGLQVSRWIVEKLKEAGYETVGDVIDAPIEELMKIKYIKNVREQVIKGAAREFFAG